MSEIAMVGDRDSILGFKSLGVEIFPVNNVEECLSALKEIIKKDYKVAFVTEQVAPEPSKITDLLQGRTFPVITMIPSNRGSTGLAMKRLQDLVRKAAGADVL
ncbi:TPA: V-type ATP synthase subunit F [Candidatus Poribacteria bacterium]|nr:V-type ATP synthase subunit F [Candidatus Poribacteria bacterium]